MLFAYSTFLPAKYAGHLPIRKPLILKRCYRLPLAEIHHPLVDLSVASGGHALPGIMPPIESRSALRYINRFILLVIDFLHPGNNACLKGLTLLE